MPVYEVEFGGKTFEVDAPDMKKAVPAARLFLARRQMNEQANAVAAKSRNRAAGGDEAYPRLPLGLALNPNTTEGMVNNVMLTLATGAPIVSALRAAPAATAAALGTGYLGSEVGERGGRKLGEVAEVLGAPSGTAKVTEAVGMIGGGLAGGVGGGRAVEAFLKGAANPAERLVVEAIAKRLAPAVGAESAAAEVAATKVLPKGQRAMATNLGGKAKPGPAPTAPEDIEAALKASLDKIKNAPPLKGPRIEVGAQKVGRQVGMTKEEVRKATGPVLDEAVGEASPILPKKALTSIIDTMKAIPVAEREAYVAKATSGKAKWQVENIRRTLEHLGLLLPVGAAAAMEGQE